MAAAAVEDEFDVGEADVLVVDSGAECTRVGFSGEDEPSLTVRTVIARANAPVKVGRVPTATRVEETDKSRVYVGDEALDRRGVLELVRPIVRSLVTDWDALEDVWRHCFTALGVDSSSMPMIVTEPPLNPRAHREQLVRRCFDVFGAPAAYVAVQPVLAAFASGRTTALVVDLGASVSHVVPIWEGFVLPHAIRRLGIAGAQLTEYLARLLTEKGHYFNTADELELVSRIKCEHAYVALDPDAEWLRFGAEPVVRAHKSREEEEDGGTGEGAARAGAASRAAASAAEAGPAAADAPPALVDYELPDGQLLPLTSERFRCMEALFAPSLVGREEPGLTECVLGAVLSSGIDVRRDLYRSILLSGGTSNAAGLAQRLERDVAAGAPASAHVRVHAAAGREMLPWQGGALLSALPDFAQMWISRAEYAASGPSCVHVRCVAAHQGG